MAKAFGATPLTRIGNKMIIGLLRLGVPMGKNILLTVPGRKSGVPRTTPVTMGEGNGQRWLASPFGQVDWVRNLRAAGTATLTHGRRSETIYVTELSPQEAAPIIKSTMAYAPSFIRNLVKVPASAPVEDFVAVAANFPTFIIKPTGAAAKTPPQASRA